MRELELRGAMDMIERARTHTYGGNPCVTGIDHFETVTLLYHLYLDVKTELDMLVQATEISECKHESILGSEFCLKCGVAF